VRAGLGDVQARSASAVGLSGSFAAATASMISSTRVMEEPFSRGVLRIVCLVVR